MANAIKVKQLFFSLPNNVGLLMEITEALAKAKINVEAICAYAWEELDASFMMVTDDNTKAKKVLLKMGAKVDVEDVMYRLYVLQKIEAGEKDVAEGRTSTHKDAVERLSKKWQN